MKTERPERSHIVSTSTGSDIWDNGNQQWQSKGRRVGMPFGGSDCVPGLHTAANAASKARKQRSKERRDAEDALDPEGADERKEKLKEVAVQNKMKNEARVSWRDVAMATAAAEEALLEQPGASSASSSHQQSGATEPPWSLWPSAPAAKASSSDKAPDNPFAHLS